MENEKNLEEIQEEMIPEAQAEAAGNIVAEESAAAAQMEENAGEEAAKEEATPVSAEEKPKEKKATPGKLALVVAAIVVVAAVIVALMSGGKTTEAEVAGQEPEATVEEVQAAVPTIPEDGNPEDETCKGTYTVTDAQAEENAQKVVATVGEHALTNGQLQVFYWMQVQNFLASEYGSYVQYYGMLDYTQPLDMQQCPLAERGTWQQMFLKEALNSWRNYCALSDKAAAAGMTLTDEDVAYLEGLEEQMQAAAEYYGLEDYQELLRYNIGAGAGMDDYRYFQKLLMLGNTYYDAEYAKLTPTQEEMDAYYAEHESEMTESGITREGKFVDVRHILFVPEGGTADENGATIYSEEEWAACEEKARSVLDQWTRGEATEESFAQLAMAMSQDPGSQSAGGLYENVYEGQMVEEFESWCFDEAREPGHYGVVKTSYGYHLMYYVDSVPVWQYYTQEQMVQERENAFLSALAEEYPMDVSYGDISLGFVDMAA